MGARARKQRLGVAEKLEDRRLLAADTLGGEAIPFADDPDFWVTESQLSAAGEVVQNQVHAFDPTTGEESFEPLDTGVGEGGALGSVAANLGVDFDVLKSIVHNFDASGEFVFGNDGRSSVSSTTTWPYSAVGRLWMEFPNGAETSCSGVMIGEYHVLTAGHCVHSATRGGWADEIVFSAAQDGNRIGGSFRRSDFQPYGEADWSYVRSYTGWTQNQNYDWDIAMVTLDRSLGDFTGWHGYGWNSSSSFYTGNTATTAGYPGDLTPFDYDMYTDSGNAANEDVETNQLHTRGIDTAGGQSGSGVWYSGQINHAVVSFGAYTDSNGNGRYDNGEPTLYNGFNRITQSKFDNIQSWKADDASDRPPTNRPDYVPYDEWFETSLGTVSDTTPTTGQSVNVSAIVRNNGTASGGADATVRFRLSRDRDYDASTDIFLGDATISSISAFNNRTASGSFTIPNGTSGTYFIVYSVDALNTVNEYSGSNNFGSIPNSVFVTSISADAYENNDTLGTAATLPSGDQSISNLTIDAANDDDYYRWTAPASGPFSTTINFTHSNGDVDMQLLTTSGTVLDSSTSVSNSEQVTANVTAGTSYILRVYGYNGATSPFYSMTIDGPEPLPTGAGDFDTDGDYDCDDIDALVAAIVGGSASAMYDLNSDGAVDLNDQDAWLTEAGAYNLGSGQAYLLGDANLDGFVDISDFNIWNNNKFTGNGGWCGGDFNADGVTDVADFNVWNVNKFLTAFRPASVDAPLDLKPVFVVQEDRSIVGTQAERALPEMLAYAPSGSAATGLATRTEAVRRIVDDAFASPEDWQ